jgi:small GTP-binding protein
MNTIQQIQALQTNTINIRNVCVCAHIDHGKTTVCDTLLIGSKLLSQENQRVLDNKPDEISRGITIDASVTSTIQHIREQPFILNVIDTPGHIDFNWQVEQSFSLAQGAIVVVDIVEGIQAQTTALSKIIAEKNIQPILFINKLDKLFYTHTPEQILIKIASIIQTLQPIFGDKLQLQTGTVCFGCATDNWGIHAPSIKEKQITLATVMEYYAQKKQNLLKKDIPLHSCLAHAIYTAVPAPNPTQKTARCYFIDELHQKTYHIIQAGTHPFTANSYLKIANTFHSTPQIQPGMIGATTITCAIGAELTPQGQVVAHTQQQNVPVIFASVDVVHIQDSPRLTDALNYAQANDPSISYSISPVTGEYILQGQGELHLQICIERIAHALHIQLQLKDIQVVTQTQLKSVTVKYPQYSDATLIISQSDTLQIHSQYEPIIRQIVQNPYTQYCAQIQTTGIIPSIQQELLKNIQVQKIKHPYTQLRIYVGHNTLKAVQQLLAQKKATITAIQYEAQVCIIECTILLKETLGLYTQMKKCTSGNSTMQYVRHLYL